MKKIIFILSVLFLISCSKEGSCKTKMAQFYNLETEQYLNQETDCNKTAPDGYIFVKWLEPNY